MEIKLFNSKKKNIKNDLEIIVLKDLKKIDKKIVKAFKKLAFEAKEGQCIFFENRVYIGATSLKKEDLKIAFSNAIREVQKTKYENVLIDLKDLKLKEVVEGLLLGSYKFQDYKSEKVEKNIKVFIDVTNHKKNINELEKEFTHTKNICDSVNMVRSIVNTAPEDFYPISMSKKLKS